MHLTPIVLALVLLAVPLAAKAQQAGKVRVVGWLGLASPTPELERALDPLRQGLRDSGWIEGQNLRVEYRWAHGKPERLPELAADLINQQAELVVASCGPQIPAIRRASATVPIVILACSDLLSGGFVASLARPGGNMTGSVLQSSDLSGKRLQLLKELMPKLSRIAILMAAVPGYDFTPALRESKAAGRTLGIEVLDVFAVRTPDDLDISFASIARQADALIVLADPLTFLHRKQMVDAAMKHRLPVIFELKEYVQSGGLLSYGPSVSEMVRRAAYYVDRILKGAKPADLPVQQPTKFELVINMKTARALGLMIPQSVLLRADEVIQ